jgi:hypothetical protein
MFDSISKACDAGSQERGTDRYGMEKGRVRGNLRPNCVFPTPQAFETLYTVTGSASLLTNISYRPPLFSDRIYRNYPIVLQFVAL